MKLVLRAFQLFVAVLATSQGTLAQVTEQDFCRPVLDVGAREESYTRLAWQTAQQLYDNACSKENVKKDVNASAGIFGSLIGVAKAVVNLKFGSSDEQLNEFCRTYQTQYSASLTAEQAVRSVNERALDNWLKCREIDRQRVVIRPHVQRTTVSFDVQRKGGDLLTVNGVQFDSKLLTCEAPDQSTSSVQKRWRKIAPDWGGQVLRDAQEFQIKCARHAFPQAGGVVRPEADIQVLTSAGTLPITLPRDTTLPENVASEISTRLNTIEGALRAISSRAIRSFEVLPEKAYQQLAQGNTAKEIPPIPLNLKTNEGICFLSRISGALVGFGEYAVVEPVNDVWTLRISTGTGAVWAGTRCIRFHRN